jgi:hypothetical protein
VPQRRLTSEEATALAKISEWLPTTRRAQWAADLKAAAITSGPDNLIWYVELDHYVRPPEPRQEVLPLEGTLEDRDGAPIVVWIEVDAAGRLVEIQFERLRSGDLVEPQWSMFKVRSLLQPRPARPPTSGELAALERFAECLPPSEARQFVIDVKLAAFRPISSDDSWLQVEIPGYNRPLGVESRTLTRDGLIDDEDGAPIRVRVCLDSNNRLADIELLRESAGAVIEPVWSSFRFQAGPE